MQSKKKEFRKAYQLQFYPLKLHAFIYICMHRMYSGRKHTQMPRAVHSYGRQQQRGRLLYSYSVFSWLSFKSRQRLPVEDIFLMKELTLFPSHNSSF